LKRIPMRRHTGEESVLPPGLPCVVDHQARPLLHQANARPSSQFRPAQSSEKEVKPVVSDAMRCTGANLPYPSTLPAHCPIATTAAPSEHGASPLPSPCIAAWFCARFGTPTEARACGAVSLPPLPPGVAKHAVAAVTARSHPNPDRTQNVSSQRDRRWRSARLRPISSYRLGQPGLQRP